MSCLCDLLSGLEVHVRCVNDEIIITFACRKPAVGFKFWNENGDVITMLKMTIDEQATVSIQPVDKDGNPAEVDGAPVWTVSNEGPISFEVAPDGLSALVKGENVGTCQLNLTGDADLGEGTKPFTGLLDVEILAGGAVAFQINVGPVEEQ
jgi:hypothetical protein